MEINIYTDGGAINNPGPAAIGFVIYRGKKILVKHSAPIGIATNNVAEYTALLEALKEVNNLIKNRKIYRCQRISAFSDSKLMVNQLNGLFKVKDHKMRSFIIKIRFIERELNIPIAYHHILREKNRLADSLVKLSF